MAAPSLDELTKMVQLISRSRFQAFINEPKVSLEPFETSELIYRPWMALILITGDLIRISLKVHFQMKHAQQLSCGLYETTSDAVSHEQAFEVIRELCNLIAGAVKSELGGNGITTEISLPVGMRGWEEFFFSLEEQGERSGAWSLVTAKGRLEFSMTVERFQNL